MAPESVLEALSDVARSMFPAVFAPDIEEGGRLWPNVDAMRALIAMEESDPAFAAAIEAIKADSSLAPLLGDDSGTGVFISQDTGMGWRLGRKQLPGAFVQSAARSLQAVGGSTDSVGPLLEELARLLPRVRRLVAGEPDEAIVVTAFVGIAMQEGVAAPTPWGTFRGASPFESSQRPFGNPSPSAVLETAVPLRWKLGEPGEATHSKEFAAAESDPTLFVLSALLALGSGTPARWVWRSSLGPLELGRSFRGALAPASPWPWMEVPAPAALSLDEVAEIVAWAERVASAYDASIAVAVRRLLSAVSERTFNVEDALIDAVIAWENLFGTGASAEMTFRVTSALAILLEPDSSARLSLRSELGKVYSLRSKVAHGGEATEKDKLAERKDQAITVAIEALRALFEAHPELVRDRERGMRLILGAHAD